MNSAEYADFLDLLYTAPIELGQWVPAMERLADLTGGTSVWLSRLSVADGLGSGITARIDPAMPRRYVEHYGRINPFAVKRDPRRYIRAWQPAIRFHEDFVPRDEVVRTEFYNDFLKPQGIGATMMIGLAADGMETCVLNVNTPADGFIAGQIAVARRLHAHLRRAFDLTRRLGGGGLDGDALASEHSDKAIFVVDAIGRVRHASPAAQRVTGADSGLRLSDGCLAPSDRAASAMLLRLIGAAASRADSDPGGTVAIPRGIAPPLTATVTPLPRGVGGVFADARLALVCLTGCGIAPLDIAARLRTVFGLTAAEARVAVELLDGQSPREVAAKLGVSFHTVRNQLQSLYNKTTTSRQSALVLSLAAARAGA